MAEVYCRPTLLLFKFLIIEKKKIAVGAAWLEDGRLMESSELVAAVSVAVDAGQRGRALLDRLIHYIASGKTKLTEADAGLLIVAADKVRVFRFVVGFFLFDLI